MNKQDKVLFEMKGDAVELFMKEVTRKSKVKSFQAYGDKIPTPANDLDMGAHSWSSQTWQRSDMG